MITEKKFEKPLLNTLKKLANSSYSEMRISFLECFLSAKMIFSNSSYEEIQKLKSYNVES